MAEQVRDGGAAPGAARRVKRAAVPARAETPVQAADGFDMERFLRDAAVEEKRKGKVSSLLRAELALISASIEGLVTMEAADPIRYTPTLSPSFNRAMQLGGAPANCTYVITGPYGTGKTAIAELILISGQRHGELAVFIDAEHAADTHEWFRALGTDLAGAGYYRPETYEQTVLHISKIIDNFIKAKAAGKIPEDRLLNLVVDSINKLVPKSELEQLFKTDLGRQYPLRAMLNSAWLDRMTPIVGKHGIRFILLAQESQNVDAGMFGKKTKLKGGDRLGYEATALIRMNYVEQVFEKPPAAAVEEEEDADAGEKKGKDEKDKENDGKVFAGRILHYTVVKNKVGVALEDGTLCISTGKGAAPLGFDFPREVLLELEHRNALSSKTVTVPGRKKPTKVLWHPLLAGVPDADLPPGKGPLLRLLRTATPRGRLLWEEVRDWLDEQRTAERGGGKES